MSTQILPLPAVAERLASYAAAAAAARDRANDPDTRGRYAGLVHQYDQLAASVHAALVTTAPVRLPAAPKRSPSVARTVSAERFWQAAGEAQRAIIAAYGLSWAVRAPIGETILATVPAGLQRVRTERGTIINYRADHRFPAAKYWPDGRIPAGLKTTEDGPREIDRSDYVAALRRFQCALRNRRQSTPGDQYWDRHDATARKFAADIRAMRLAGFPKRIEHDAAWHEAHGYVLYGGNWRFPQEVHRSQALIAHAENEAARKIAEHANAIGWASR